VSIHAWINSPKRACVPGTFLHLEPGCTGGVARRRERWGRASAWQAELGRDAHPFMLHLCAALVKKERRLISSGRDRRS